MSDKKVLYNDIRDIEDSISSLSRESNIDISLQKTDVFIEKIDIRQLQNAINTLESNFSSNCCQSDSCQSCQADICESCQDYCSQCSSVNQGCQNGCIQCSDTNQGCQNGCNECSQCSNCSSDNDCCLAEGTLISCFIDNKFSLKKIEDIQPNDIVVGANGELNVVYARTDTVLGSQRIMYTFVDNSLYFTGEHAMWVHYQNKEYFGIHDISSYYREKAAIVNGKPILEWEQEETYRKNNITGRPISKGLSKEPIFVLFTAEYGTDKGWKLNKSIVAKNKVYEDNTPVHTLIVGGNHTYFANGYLVSGFATDVDYDYSKVEIKDLKLKYEKI